MRKNSVAIKSCKLRQSSSIFGNNVCKVLHEITFIAISLVPTLILHSVLPLRNFSKIRKKPSNTLPDPGIEPETPCSAVALATTRPTRQAVTIKYYTPKQ
ncbi:hypothetical protein SFRURICE_016645 [Spodoptera frugiperda]|nr:hypothetical protein SFRURICE_016645 [Spodoptera frugiperda]